VHGIRHQDPDSGNGENLDDDDSISVAPGGCSFEVFFDASYDVDYF